MEEMKPCPFCGKQSGVVNKSGSSTYYPTCTTPDCLVTNISDCGWCVEVGYDSEEKAILAWNTRAGENKDKSTMKIEFSTDNDAFQGRGFSNEIYKIFADIQVLLALGYDEREITDSNGNIVGHWYLKEK